MLLSLLGAVSVYATAVSTTNSRTSIEAALARELASAPTASYATSSVLRITPHDQIARDHVRALEDFHVDFWTDPRKRNGPVDLRVPSQESVKLVEDYLAINPSGPIEHAVLLDRLQDHIDAQLIPASTESIIEDDENQLVFEELSDPAVKEFERLAASHHAKYHPIGDINAFIDTLVTTFPSVVSTFVLGKTYEGRDQRAVVISAPSSVGSSASKKQLVFHGGQHAREWIGPAVMQFLLSELLLRYSKSDSVVTNILNNFDIVIIPVLNVDGYVYTHTRDRMWRKNRQPNKGTSCVGTDPNRNWGYKWGGGGSSANPCSESYQGPSAFSAPENKNMANYLLDHAGTVAAYIDFHAYSQLWMFPFGADCNDFADAIVEEAGREAAKALKAVHGKNFEVGSICNIIYQAAGSSCDWAYTSANVTFAYGVELRDQGIYGFLLPAKQIVPSGEEVYASIIALAQFILKNAV